jgi:hypothetical protein
LGLLLLLLLAALPCCRYWPAAGSCWQCLTPAHQTLAGPLLCLVLLLQVLLP